MKKLLLLLIATLLSGIVFAQSGTMLPDGFIVPNLAEAPACMVDDKGKIYFNTTTNLIMACDGTHWKPTVSQWSNNESIPKSINYSGKVGINTQNPEYNLDVDGNARVSNKLFVTQSIGIGTTTSNLALEVVDGDIGITSIADAKTWKFDYSDDDNYFSLKEDGITRMIFSNAGNVGIGSVVPTAKLSVEGTGRFTGNLTVKGKGIVRSSTAASMKIHIGQANLGSSFSISAAQCANSFVDISAGNFTVTPTVQAGNLVSGTGNFGKLVVNIQSATSTGVVVRLCNNTTSIITVSNIVFNVLCIGV